jgi:hypothetical protein
MHSIIHRIINISRFFFLSLKKLLFLRNRLVAIYDLNKIAAGFDFFHFIENTLQYCRDKKINVIDLVILSSSDNNIFSKKNFRKEAFNKLDYAKSRMGNIIYQSLHLLDNINNIQIIKERSKIYSKILINKVYPEYYSPFMSKDKYADKVFLSNIINKNYSNKKIVGINNLKINDNFINNFKKKIKKKIITITLRESSYNTYMNSNIKNWLKICEYLKKKKYFPIVIRDFESIYKNDAIQKYNLLPEASFNLGLKISLYENAFFNLTVGGGNGALLSVLKKAKFAMWKFNSKKNPENFNNLIFWPHKLNKKKQGFLLNNKKKLIIFEDDSFLNIKSFIDYSLKSNLISEYNKN